MDSATHLAMGVAIGGLATVDPTFQSADVSMIGLMGAMIISQQAPDIDTVLKLKGNGIYIRNHRGITHSLPFLFIWPALITIVFGYLFNLNMTHLFLWSFFAVFLHVFVDIFNSYGTQALRPITKTWIGLGFINTFDWFIFGTHVIAIALWLIYKQPLLIFGTLYLILAVYYIIRYLIQRSVKRSVTRLLDDEVEQIIIASTSRFFQWRVAVTTKNKYYVARAYRTQVMFLESFDRISLPKEDPIILNALKDENVKSFLSFSKVYRWHLERLPDNGFLVVFTDLRYRSNGHYPFVAVVKLDSTLKIHSSYTGWIFTEGKLQKKLFLDEQYL
ncbi:metal-dependent hydrolase [Brochothrix thermosphacta]|uniref:metal-dependent hydrolase n=1 Tax=Brochothrix thermosphacta TaxID=2756 RepID=UPI0039B0E4E8